MGGQEDYQRIMLQQQQNQAIRAMASGSPGFNQQMMGGAAGQAQQHQLAAQMQQQQHQQQQQQAYRMSPPSTAATPFSGGMGGGVAGGMNAPSPTGGQSWGTNPQVSGGGGYPFAPSPAGSDQRHMSGTPGPPQQQQQQQHQVQMVATGQNTSPTDMFDFLNWNG